MDGTVKADAARRRVKENQDKAAKRGTKRTKSSPEAGQTDAPATTTTTRSSSSSAALALSSSSSSDAARTGRC